MVPRSLSAISLLCISLFLQATADALYTQTYFTQDACSVEPIIIGRDELVTLIFDAKDTSSAFDEECHIHVQTSRRDDRIMFRFTRFDIALACQDSNITVYDGDVSDPIVKGLPVVLCGTNRTLTEATTVLESSEDDLTIAYSYLRNSRGIRGASTVQLQFTTFHEGTCDPKAREYTCDNGRCIDEHLRCEGVNPCGDNSDCNLETATDVPEGSACQKQMALLRKVWPLILVAACAFTSYLYFRQVHKRLRKGSSPGLSSFLFCCKWDQSADSSRSFRKGSKKKRKDVDVDSGDDDVSIRLSDV